MKGLWPLCSAKAEGKHDKLHDFEFIKVLIRPLGVRFFSLRMFFSLSLSVNNKLVNNTLVNHLEKMSSFF